MNSHTTKLGQQNPVPESENTIMRWLSLYETHLFQSAAPGTYERYCRVLNKFFFDCFPEKRSPIEFLRADCESYKTARLSEVTRTTVLMEISIIRGFFAFVVRLGGTPLNPMLNVKVPNPERKKRSLAFPDLVPTLKSSLPEADDTDSIGS